MWPYALSKIGYASANATRLSKIRGYLLADLPSVIKYYLNIISII